MLKQQIQNLVDQYCGSYKHIKDKLFKRKFGESAYFQVLEATTFLSPNVPFSLRARCVVDGVASHPTCKMCSNHVVFNSNKGWLTYCSNECRFKDYTHIQEKKRATNLDRYGATNVLASHYVINKRKLRKIDDSKSQEVDAKYLNEKNLGKFIAANITKNYLHDRPIPGSESRKRFDYILPDQKLIIEFDGDSHFTSAKAIVNDLDKEELAQSFDYSVIRIPYFIQLDDAMINHYFGEYITHDIIKFEFNQYPHGFIDPKARTPGDFCELGQKRFMDTWKSIPHTVQLQLGYNLSDISHTAGSADITLFSSIIHYLFEIGIYE